MTTDRYSLKLESRAIVIKSADGYKECTISFKRTVRVPDSGQTSKLPPSLGTFPLYKIKDYHKKLSPAISMKGGAFLPIYKHEAMWINFEATAPFLVKIYAGGINVVSGESYQENLATTLLRQTGANGDKSVQDYVVLPTQKWLDGIATSPGVVSQFVATNFGDGYSVEAQITGEDSVGGLLFEITPITLAFSQELRKEIQICARTLNGKTIILRVPPDAKVMKLKEAIQAKEGIPPDRQRLIYAGKQLDDASTLWKYGLSEGATVHLTLRLRGGRHSNEQSTAEMATARGGKIAQAIRTDEYHPSIWSPKDTMAFNVQLLNSEVFQAVTGDAPPPTPVTMQSYTDAGLPFFKMYEEDSEVHGNFSKVKSIGQLDNKIDKHLIPRLIRLGPNGRQITDPYKNDGRKATPQYQAMRAVVSDPDMLLNPTGPLREFRTRADLLKGLTQMRINDFD